MRNTRRSMYAGALAVTLALGVAACGGSPTEPADTGQPTEGAGNVLAEYAALTGPEREERLKTDAEAEGALSVYTSWTYMDALVDGFSDKYDIDVSVYRAGSETVLQRLLQEDKANFHGADVLETNQLEMTAAQQEGLFGEYASEFRDQTREEAQFEDWTATRFNAFVVQWNTDNVKPEEEPKSFEELASDRWKGRLVMELGDAAWMQALYGYYEEQGKSQEEIDALFAGMAANSEVSKGHTATSELVSAGQYDVFPSQYLQTVEKSKAKGAPVAWRPAQGEPPQPIVIQANGMAVMENAPHPAAATLFMDYALSDEGQEIIVGEVLIGAREGGEDPLAGLDVIPLPAEELVSEGKEWEERYAELLRGK